MQEKGEISVQTQHIFPIIKRWLYSEKDIFLREVICNSCDAVTKFKHLVAIGKAQTDESDYRITVKLDKEAKTLTVSDNGIGMSADEVKEYINKIALSGALDFIQKYEGADEQTSADGIIGHFGLGFYSVFMVADKVTMKTKSYDGSPACLWSGSDEGEFEMADYEKENRGTEITLFITEDNAEFLEKDAIITILNKYASFMPVSIYFQCGEDEEVYINETQPLWQKNPSQCEENEYNEFYHKVFKDFKEPLFHIHINADYPLNFKGILYFPRINHEYESLEGQVKLYYNRVFVADNIKDVIPEYLLMLKGVLDCPELPLNVSRSSLQNNAYVAKVSQHITKKVCDKLISLHDTEFDKYKEFWSDIKTFVEYACLKDKKFYDKVKDVVIFKTVDNEYLTLKEYGDKKVYYATDATQQAMYISAFKSENIKILLLDSFIDANFITFIEQNEKDFNFVRVDADTDALKSDSETIENEKLKELFKEVSNNKDLKVEFTSLKDDKIPAMLKIDEQSRRFAEMMKMYSKDTPQTPEEITLVLNTQNPLIKKLEDSEEDDKLTILAKQIYTLTLLGQRKLSASELNEFLSDSYSILENLQ